MKSLQNFLAHIDASLDELDDFLCPPIQRTNDVYIMDLVLHSNSFTPKEICLINYCCMYLQAIMMADICLTVLFDQ
jgi:hypothetical protein